MNRSQLIKEVAKRLNVHKDIVLQILVLCFNRITELVLQGERVVIQKFGVFMLRKNNAKLGYNPRNGRRFFIPKSSKFTFKPTSCLLEQQKHI